MAPQRVEFCALVGKPLAVADALAVADDELHTALADVETLLAQGGDTGQIRLTDDGELIIPQLTAEDVPAEAGALRDEMSGMLPRVPFASVLVEVDARTGFLDHLVHAGGKVNRPAELKRNLIYVIIAEATNMGLTAMAESCGVPYDVLAWTAEWYFRPETLEAANAAIVNYHHRLPLTSAFGPGTLSSSAGQRFPTKGKSITARAMSRYFARGQGVSVYTHVSDQHSTLDTKVIVATAPEGHYVLDGHLGNATDLPVVEHATDTHGASLANFALFDLVGRQLSPRIRHLGKITLYRTGPKADFVARYPRGIAPHGVRGPVSCRRVVPQAHRPAAEQGREPALPAPGTGLRRRGRGPAPHHEQQSEQMWCLTLATNAIVIWTTEYYGLAITALRRGGRRIDDNLLAHIWPSHHANVNFYGTHSVDIDGELAKLDADGYRPLRLPTVPTRG